MKSTKPDDVSPQHSSGKKERESSEMNDYEDEGDLLEEEEVSERETTAPEITYTLAPIHPPLWVCADQESRKGG